MGDNSSRKDGGNKLCYIMYFLSLERLFGKAWREEFVVLYEDSSLIWFRDRDRLDPEGGVFLRDAPEMLAAGQVTLQGYTHTHSVSAKLCKLLNVHRNIQLHFTYLFEIYLESK